MLDPKGRGLAVLVLGKRERYERSNREATSAIGCSGNPSRIGSVGNV